MQEFLIAYFYSSKMKIHCAWKCVILSLGLLFVAGLVLLNYYVGMPTKRPMSCLKLSEANHPRSAIPYVAQGSLLAVGFLFFILSTSFMGKVRNWKKIVEFQAWILLLIWMVLYFTVVLADLMNNRPLSPSFIDSYKPNPPVSELCGKNVSAEIYVNLNCTAPPIEWIPALSTRYPPMIILQSYLMFNLMVWAAFATYSKPVCVVVVAIAMALVSAIGTAAVGQNEASYQSIFVDYFMGGLWCFLVWISTFPALHELLTEEATLPHYVSKEPPAEEEGAPAPLK